MDKTKTKKNVPLMCVAVVLSVALCVALAVGLSTRTCAVTFRQEGQPDIVRIVPRGGRLKDVPEIEQVPGYTTVWNVDDFSCVKEDLLVETVTSPNQYTIFYDTGKEEAVIETTTQEVTYGTSYTLARPTCEGYTFGNWVIQYSTTEVRDGVYEFTSDLPLSAVWIPHEFTITYETGKPEAQIAQEKQQALYGEPCVLETPVCEGFAFTGWQIKGTETILENGDPYPIVGDITLVAQWEPDGASGYWLTDFESSGGAWNLYTVTFRQEGRKDIVRTVYQGGAVKDVPKVTPVPGYNVMWSVKDLSKITSDLVVVAVKIPCKYTITYDTVYAQAQIARTQQQVTYGEAYTLETAKCEGFRFKGWKIKGTQTMFASSGQYRQTGSITLEAVWDKDVTSQLWITDFEFDPNARNTYTVTFRQTGYPDVTRTVTEGEALTEIPDPKPVEGYTVIWSVGDFSSVSRDLTVTAVQLLGKYTITYETGHANAQISQTQQRVTYGEAYTLATPECEGYTFQNWKIKDTGEIFESGDAYRRGSDVTLTAVWKPNEYTITYDPVNNRAEMAQKLQTVRFGEAYTLLRPTCDGYTFKQWQIKETGEAFDSGSGYPYAGNITLVARWEKDPNSSYWLTDFEADDSLVGKKYTITYDKVYAHAKLEQKELRVATGEAYTLATPECDGYTFKGWKLEGTETVFTDGDEYPYSYGITLVAVWEKKPTSSYWITDFEYDVQ